MLLSRFLEFTFCHIYIILREVNITWRMIAEKVQKSEWMNTYIVIILRIILSALWLFLLNFGPVFLVNIIVFITITIIITTTPQYLAL